VSVRQEQEEAAERSSIRLAKYKEGICTDSLLRSRNIEPDNQNNQNDGIRTSELGSHHGRIERVLIEFAVAVAEDDHPQIVADVPLLAHLLRIVWLKQNQINF
jgi:hypothetical protein